MITREHVNAFWLIIFDDLINIAEQEAKQLNLPVKEQPRRAPPPVCKQRETKNKIKRI